MEEKFYPALGERVTRCTLDNGLALYVDHRPEFGKQFAFFAVNYGGMDLRFMGEDGCWNDSPAGIAHFLEHKMFDTQDGNALQILSANGAEVNAFTAPSITGYYFEGTDGFEENLETLLRFVSVPYFTPESVDKEQGIIAQEIRMGEDNPDTVIYYMLLEALYQKHPIRVKVIGSEQSIAGITADTLYRCHGLFYRPANMVLCVAGNVDAARVADIARAVLPREGGARTETERAAAEPERVCRARVERRMEVSAPQFLIGFKGDAAPAGGCLRQQLLSELACDVLFSPSAPLYGRLYEEGLINGSFGGGCDSAPGCARMTVGGESRDPDAVRADVEREVARLAKEGIEPALFTRMKNALYGMRLRVLDVPDSYARQEIAAIFAGEHYADFASQFDTITPEDVQAAYGCWSQPERSCMSVVEPK